MPRHTLYFGDLASLQAQIRDERVRALTAFRSDVAGGGFPNDTKVVTAAADEFAGFIEAINKS